MSATRLVDVGREMAGIFGIGNGFGTYLVIAAIIISIYIITKVLPRLFNRFRDISRRIESLAEHLRATAKLCPNAIYKGGMRGIEKMMISLAKRISKKSNQVELSGEFYKIWKYLLDCWVGVAEYRMEHLAEPYLKDFEKEFKIDIINGFENIIKDWSTRVDSTLALRMFVSLAYAKLNATYNWFKWLCTDLEYEKNKRENQLRRQAGVLESRQYELERTIAKLNKIQRQLEAIIGELGDILVLVEPFTAFHFQIDIGVFEKLLAEWIAGIDSAWQKISKVNRLEPYKYYLLSEEGPLLDAKGYLQFVLENVNEILSSERRQRKPWQLFKFARRLLPGRSS